MAQGNGTTRSPEGITRTPLPGSRKIYVPGEIHADIRVPMREVALEDTQSRLPGQAPTPNPPVTLYDTSGPYTDPDVSIDLRAGLPALRAPWIESRGDSEQLGELTSAFARERQQAGGDEHFPSIPLPRRALAGRRVDADALRQEGHRHARDGVHRHPREHAPPCPARARRAQRPALPASWSAPRRAHPRADHARVRAGRSRRRAARSSPATSTTPSSSRWPSAAPSS